MWSVVDFGKFKGKGLSVPQIVFKDPDWFFWATENNAFKGRQAIEAKDIAAKVRRIKINKPEPSDWKIEYLFLDGKFAQFSIVPEDRPAHVGSSIPMYDSQLDFKIPRQARNYDKLGYKHFLKTFRYHWFDDKNFTKERCEAFFDNDDNFV